MMAHDGACSCQFCTAVRARSVEILPEDRDMLAQEWLNWIGDRDGEVRKLREGENGGPGSPRWVSLQAIARARIAAEQLAKAKAASA